MGVMIDLQYKLFPTHCLVYDLFLTLESANPTIKGANHTGQLAEELMRDWF